MTLDCAKGQLLKDLAHQHIFEHSEVESFEPYNVRRNNAVIIIPKYTFMSSNNTNM